MRILLVNSLYPTPLYPKIVGGAEKSVKNIAEALVAAGHSVEVIRAAPPNAQMTCEEVNGVVIHSIPIKNIYWPFSGESQNPLKRLAWHLLDDRMKAPKCVIDILDRFQPDVLHTNNLTALGTDIWKAARDRGIRIVHTLRDYSLMCPRTMLFRNGKLCEKLCTNCAILTAKRRTRTDMCDAVVGNSFATLNLHLREGLFRNATMKTAIGSLPETDAVPFPPRQRLQDEGLTFGYIGRVSEEKGVDMLAEAFGKLPAGSARLKIAGESSPEIQARLQAAAGSAQIDFLGFITPKSFYEQVDVVVAPSLWPEPLPRSIIDSISYGRPVITSNRGGNVEALGEPPYGWAFDPAVEGDLVRKIKDASPMLVQPSKDDRLSPLELYEKVYHGAA